MTEVPNTVPASHCHIVSTSFINVLLQAHKRGKDVAKGIQLICKMERAEGEEFEGLIEELSAMAAAKHLFGTQSAPGI